MIKRILVITLLLVKTSVVANAAQVKKVKDGDEVEVDISISELNRIKVKGDKIASLKTNQGDLEVLEEATLGELYIKPLHNNKEEISLFITTQKAKTYKLSLISKDIGAQQIFLTNQNSPESVINQNNQKPASILKTFQSKNKKFDASSAKVIKEIDVSGYELYLVKSEVMGDVVAEIYSFYNRNSFFAELNPDEFLSANKGNWVAISISNKSPSIGDYSTIYVVREKK